jgi:hypothetical protein
MTWTTLVAVAVVITICGFLNSYLSHRERTEREGRWFERDHDEY